MKVEKLWKSYSLLNLACTDFPHATRSFVGRIRRDSVASGLFSAPAQKGHPYGWPFAKFDAWQFPTLAWGSPTLPSALRRFTSEFGMGSGGTTALSPPGKFFVLCPVSFPLILRRLHSRKSVTYFSMLLPSLHLPPCLSVKSFGL